MTDEQTVTQEPKIVKRNVRVPPEITWELTKIQMGKKQLEDRVDLLIERTLRLAMESSPSLRIVGFTNSFTSLIIEEEEK